MTRGFAYSNSRLFNNKVEWMEQLLYNTHFPTHLFTQSVEQNMILPEAQLLCKIITYF
jgi:hypothetical protein